MQLKPEEISKIIRAQIKHYENVIEQSEVGTLIIDKGYRILWMVGYQGTIENCGQIKVFTFLASTKEIVVKGDID